MDNSKTTKNLQKFFLKHRITTLNDLYPFLKTDSRMTVFRHLKKSNYLSSYSHTGRFYTLPDIPLFDEYGLWRYKNVSFSKHGTLKATVIYLVKVSNSGITQKELTSLLNVRVQNTLKNLFDNSAIDRCPLGNIYLYVHQEQKIAKIQFSNRQKHIESIIRIDPYLIIQVLLKIINENKRDPAKIAKSMNASGEIITISLIEKIFLRYNIKKK